MGLKDRLSGLASRTLQKVDRFADDTLARIETTHKGIVDRGGYVKATKEAIDDVFDSTKRAYHSVEDALFTDGEFDKEKARKLLGDAGEATREYGSKAAVVMRNLAKDGLDEAGHAIDKQFRRYVPTEQERLTTYAGIGTKYTGILLRQNLDDCLAFYDEANKKLPARLGGRREILDDIKASASGNSWELEQFYKDQENSVAVARKLVSVAKHLS